MSTDWRALRAELLEALDGWHKAVFETGTGWVRPDETYLIDRARAALAVEADGPAVQSREPASVVGEPSDEELLDIAAQAIDGYSSGIKLGEYEAENEIAIEAYGSELITFARAALARYGHQPAPPAEGVDRSHISDGYHTFAELYDHRHSLMLALMRAIPKLCWFSQRHADGEMPFGTTEWFIAGVDLPTGAITYHLPSELLSLAQQTGAAELSVGRPWDGHTANDVIERLRAWVASPQPAPPVEVAPGPTMEGVGPLIAWLTEQAHQAADASQPTDAGMLAWAAQVIGERVDEDVPAPPAATSSGEKK